ncbi:MAG: polysaccharide deacetylase family protein [Bacteroidales bacterium]|nr:polysaccharide deacetylase family protein [Bacteroidales bacterium]
MLLIYTDRQTNRLGYTINLIFNELLGVDYMVTTSTDQFIALSGAKLSYCKNKIYDELHIACKDLLFETNIYSFDTECITEDSVPKIFINRESDDSLGFDVFAAVFYMVSRYEEHLPFIKDEHSRFCATDSIAYKNGFLDKPVVNIWAECLKKELAAKYPELKFKKREFNFVNTIDVDQAYSYKGKGLYRSLGGLARDISKKDFRACIDRIKVLLTLEKDPYDCFDYLLNVKTKYKLNTIFFFLFARHSRFDKNISVYNHSFLTLIKKLSDYTTIGIHPSYFSAEYPGEVDGQIKRLSDVIHKSVKCSRFHYLRFSLPQSYRNLIASGIHEDYSMGYANTAGFRAGICVPYNFYDLEKDCETKLRLHPFMFMDVALKNGMNLKADKAFEVMQKFIDAVKAVGGEFISIWHNESLSSDRIWQGWRQVYQKQTEYISQYIKTNK